ncbi:MAG: protein-glutamate O-methyltransferase CheR [Myxococcales bacterium]|nr:protein-glutamate O-methyltransferase CheR [Myxococcales bacterium]MDD9969831.1 protein-glutamate O-methyltransferase CheR [Myxococcales bacterium]
MRKSGAARVAPRMTAEEFRLLREFINEHSGIKIGEELRPIVERRLGERVVALRIGSFREYYHFLCYHPRRHTELERTMEILTTNETYFFREWSQLRAFRSQVLPSLKEAASVRKSLTVWSAGCSSGEEVYSLAILIEESGLFDGWEVRVFGNDISRKVLQVARAGTYRESSFRAMPEGYERFFTRTPEGRVVHPRIRSMCVFGHFNLLDQARVAIVGQVDAIFCRNVLIYFDKESRRRLIESFYERLHPGGYLMLGHSESLLHASTAFQLAHLHGDLAYRKPISSQGEER